MQLQRACNAYPLLVYFLCRNLIIPFDGKICKAFFPYQKETLQSQKNAVVTAFFAVYRNDFSA